MGQKIPLFCRLRCCLPDWFFFFFLPFEFVSFRVADKVVLLWPHSCWCSCPSSLPFPENSLRLLCFLEGCLSWLLLLLRFQPVLSEDMSKKVNLLFPAAGLGVLDCRTGGRGFDSRDRTNTQGLKITEKWRYSLCPANDETFAWRSSISTSVLNIHWHSIECIFFPNCHFSLLNVTPWSLAC